LAFAVLIQFLLPHPVPHQVAFSSEWRQSTRELSATSRLSSAPICLKDRRHVFVFEPQASPVRKMALLDRARKIAAEFDFGPEEVRKSVEEFIKEMGKTASEVSARISHRDTDLLCEQMRGCSSQIKH
jgi:hexokinase